MSRQQLLDPTHPWQCKAASVICVLSETIFGASCAWLHPWHDPPATQLPSSASHANSTSSRNQQPECQSHHPDPHKADLSSTGSGSLQNGITDELPSEQTVDQQTVDQQYRSSSRAADSQQQGGGGHEGQGVDAGRGSNGERSRPPALDTSLMVMILEELVQPCIRNLATHNAAELPGLQSSFSQQVRICVESPSAHVIKVGVGDQMSSLGCSGMME